MEKKIHPSSTFCEYNHTNESLIERFFGGLYKFKGKLMSRSVVSLYEYVAFINKYRKSISFKKFKLSLFS